MNGTRKELPEYNAGVTGASAPAVSLKRADMFLAASEPSPTVSLKQGDGAGETKRTVPLFHLLINYWTILRIMRNCPVTVDKNGEINGRISEGELMILSVLKKLPSMTNTDLAAASGKSERTISRLLAALKNKKLIQRIGSNKTGYWKVL